MSKLGPNSEKKIKAYIDELSSQVRLRKTRSLIVEEIRSHVEDIFEEEVNQGKSEDEAVKIALNRMGDAISTGKSLQYTHRYEYYINRIVQLSVVCFCLLFVFYIGSSQYFRKKVDYRLGEARKPLENHFQNFYADQQYLASFGILNTKIEGKDAGSFLNHKIHPDGEEYSSTKVPVLWKNILKSKNWLSSGINSKVGWVNYPWLRAIENFDYWDAYKTGPHLETQKKYPHLHPSAYTIPEFSRLLLIGKMELVRGIKNGNLLDSLKLVRKLAILMYSTDELTGTLAAIALLKYEREAFFFGKNKDLIDRNDWKAVPKDFFIRARRAIHAFPSFFDIRSNENILTKFTGLLKNNLTVGMCSGLNQGLMMWLSTKALFINSWPLEGSPKKYFTNLDKIIQKAEKKCRQSPYTFAWNNNSIPYSDLGYRPCDGVHDCLYDLYARVPYIRQWFGLEMMSSGHAIWFSQYKNKKNSGI